MILKYLRALRLWISTIVLAVFCASMVLILFPFVYFIDRERHSLHFFGCLWARSIQFFNPAWQFHIKGRENLAPKNKGAVYVANHQSQVDILALFMLNMRFRWLSKASVFKVPFMGWAMTAIGYVPIIRGNPKSQEKCMLLAAEHIKKGTPMAFFPEGTRSVTGELGAFKTGAFRLAQATNVPIIPITISGCAKLLPKHSIIPNKASVFITVHPPIPANDYDLKTLIEETRKRILSGM